MYSLSARLDTPESIVEDVLERAYRDPPLINDCLGLKAQSNVILVPLLGMGGPPAAPEGAQ